MRYPIYVVLILASLTLCLLAQPVLAKQEPVARIAAMRGTAVATSAKAEKRPLKVRGAIYEGDTIITGKRGRLQLLFTDNTIISLGRATTFAINEYLWQPDKQDGALRSEVKEGIFRVMGGKLTKTAPEKFTTKTPAATIGIRGSMYSGVVAGDRLSVVFQGGRGIVVSNALGSVEIPKPGFGTHVKADEPPPPPTAFSSDDLGTFTEGLDGGDDDEASDDEGLSGAEDDEGSDDEGTTGDETTDDTEATEDGTAGDDTSADTEEGATTTDDTVTDSGGTDTTDDTVSSDDSTVASTTTVDDTTTASTTTETVVIDTIVPPPPTDTTPVLDTTAVWSPPSDGITYFEGSLSGSALHYSDGTTDTISEPMHVFANWHNHKVLGIVFDDQTTMGSPVFFFGDLEGSTVTNVKIFGDTGGGPINPTDPYYDPAYDTITVVEGTGNGSFRGTDTALFEMNATGYDYEVEPPDQPASGEWQVSGSAAEVASEGASTGSATWQGYVVGISEDMNNIDVARRLLTGAMTLNINKDTGTISGSISATDSSSTFGLSNITVGGTYGSAFIADDLFAAILGGGSIPLKPHGNYLVTGPDDKMFMDYATWGYWEVAYEDGGKQYHNHVPGAMWVAGKPTSVTDLAALATNNVIGNYTGKVLGSRIDPSDTMQVSDVNGTIDVSVNFAELGVSSTAIAGEMNLDGHTFGLDSMGNSGSPHFSGGLFGSGFSGTINGTMYGPNARSIGGNFSTSDGAITYQGIFGGNR